MSSAIDISGEGRFANGQSGRDLRVGSHARELETQLMEVIDSSGNFFQWGGPPCPPPRQQFNARDSKQSTEVI